MIFMIGAIVRAASSLKRVGKETTFLFHTIHVTLLAVAERAILSLPRAALT